jgi:hypothetical protein
MANAGRSAVGVNQITWATKLRDIFIVIVIPFVVPALVLPMANGPASMTLTNVAFGFVAVAVAGVARAVTSKTDVWLAYALIALTCICIQTALAVVDDTAKASANLETTVLSETVHPASVNLSAMRDSALALANSQPSTFHWICSTLLGVVLMAISFELIRREQ